MQRRLIRLVVPLLLIASAAGADYVSGLDPQGDNFLALRSGPGGDYSLLQKMGPDTELTVLDVSGNWRRVRLNDGSTGWAYAKYIAPGMPPGAVTAEPFVQDAAPGLGGVTGAVISAATLRAFALSDSPALGSLPGGSGVIVLWQSGAWLRVLGEAGAPGFVPLADIAIGARPTAAPSSGGKTDSKSDGGRAATPALGWIGYVNSRFGTAIDYPADLFIADPPPANDDGRRFRSLDGRADFVIFGQYNASNRTLSELREDDRASGRYDSVTYERTEDDWYVLSGTIGDRIYYRRVLLTGGGDTVHSFEITYPAADMVRMDPVTARMSQTFTVR